MIFRSQPGFEALLEQEVAERGLAVAERGAGWVRVVAGEAEASAVTGAATRGAEELCFAQQVMFEPVEVTGDSVNALAAKIGEFFFASAKTERFEGGWPCLFEAAAGLDGLGRREAGVAKAFFEALKKRMGRVAKLANEEKPRGVARVRGLFVFFVDFRRAFVSREVLFNGQRRMADDAQAPSRSYLKVEEAYLVLGREPAEGETVVDLGAAPGGWSYSAAKRGAKVIAVDNGPLKGGALDHPLIEHRREDAFSFVPGGAGGRGERDGGEDGSGGGGVGDGAVDWLFCDLVEDPHHVLENLITPWLEGREGRACRRFVVIFKFGRVDPLAFLREVRSAGSVFSRCAPGFRVRHLYHDREEFTVVGEVRRKME